VSEDFNKIYCGFWNRCKSALIDWFVVSTISFFITIPIIFILYISYFSSVLNNLTDLSVYSVGLNKIFVSDLLQVYQSLLLEEIASDNLSIEVKLIAAINSMVFWGYIYNILFIITLFVYMTFMLAMKRKSTYGLSAIEAIVVNKDMDNLSFLHSFFRSIITILVGIFTLGIGFLTMLFRRDKRGLHDIIAKTYVIYSNTNKSILSMEASQQVNIEESKFKHNVEYGRFWTRFPAYLIDSFIVFIASILIAALIEKKFGKLFDPFTMISFVICSAIYTIPQISSKHQATYAMRMFDIIIVDNTKSRLSLLHSFLRYIVMILVGKLTYTLGFITLLFRKDKKSLHDIIAKTYVIYK